MDKDWHRKFEDLMDDCDHPEEKRVEHTHESIKWHCTRCGYVEIVEEE